MSAPETPSTSKNFGMPKPQIKMNSWFRNKITSLYNAVTAPVAATRDALTERLQSVRSTATLLFNRAKEKLGYGQTLKEIVEGEAEKQQPQQAESIGDLAPQELETAMNKAYKSFRSAGLPKADVDTYIESMTPHIKTLIEQQTREIGSTKVQLSLWVKWKKIEEQVIALVESQGDRDGSTPGVYEVIVEKVFNSLMTEVYQGSDIEELLKQMFAYIKTQIDHPALPKSGFTLDSIMHLDINFHELQLTRGSSYIELPKWISLKKAVINPKNSDEECFKWAILAALHHEEISKTLSV